MQKKNEKDKTAAAGERKLKTGIVLFDAVLLPKKRRKKAKQAIFNREIRLKRQKMRLIFLAVCGMMKKNEKDKTAAAAGRELRNGIVLFDAVLLPKNGAKKQNRRFLTEKCV